MKLDHVIITRNWGGESYNMEVKYSGESGSTTIKLSPDLSERVLRIVGEELVKTSQAVAQSLVQDILQSSGLAQITDATEISK